MAALQEIRKKSGLVIAVVAIGLLAFIMPWSEIAAWMNKSKTEAFVVDGTSVSVQDYQARIAEWTTYTGYKTGKNSFTADEEFQIKEEVYQQMTLEIMLNNQAEKLGLGVTKQELNDLVNGMTAYQTFSNMQEYPWFVNRQTGQFDKSALEQFIVDVNAPLPDDAQARSEQEAKQLIWKVVENQIKYRKLTEKYAFLIANGVLVSNTEAQASYDAQKNTADIAYVMKPYTSVPDSTIKVDESEIKALYDKRKESYRMPTKIAKLSYFIKDVLPSEEDYAVVEAQMKEAHDKLIEAEDPAAIVSQYSSDQIPNIFFPLSALSPMEKSFVESSAVGSIYGPVRDGQSYIMYKYIAKTMATDSMKIQMIPIPEPYIETASNTIADSLVNVIKGGKTFEELAMEINPAAQNNLTQKVSQIDLIRNGIDGEKCVNAAAGEILKLPYMGGQYTMLLKVVSKDAPIEKVKLAMVKMEVAVSDKTQSIIDNELTQFISQSGNLDNFDKAATDKGYGIMSNATVYPNQPSLMNSEGTRSVINWVFNEKRGVVKKFDLSDKRVVAIAKGVIDEKYSPLSEVSETLKAEIIRDKKAVQIIDELKSKNLTSLDAYAQTINAKVDTAKFVNFQTANITSSGLGYEPIMNVYSKIGETNKLAAPLKGIRGVFALSVLNKTEDTRPFDAAQIKQTISQNNYYQTAQQALGALQLKANIKDNRIHTFNF